MTRKRLIVLVQVLATIAVLAALLRLAGPRQLLDNLKRAPWWSLPAGLASMTLTLWVAAIRWNALLRAYGASMRPPTARLFQLHVIGMLYNMLPGSVGGDVLRGIVTRSSFSEGGATAGLTIVLIERVIGLCGLILLACTLLLLRPIAGVEIAWAVAGLGLVGCAIAVGAIGLGRRLAPYLPRRLAALATALPPMVTPAWFAVALAWSVVSQVLVGITGHAFVVGLDPSVSVLDSLTLAPLASAATYLPVTVGGAGTRDVAMVALYAAVGVSQADALGASIQLLLAFIVYALIGAVVSMRSAIGRELADAVRKRGEKA